jgi:hypothetical protein
LSRSVAAGSDPPMTIFRYFDVVVVAVAAPIMLLIGVPAFGYLLGAGAWIALRAVGLAMERAAGAVKFNQAIGIRLAYMLSRLFLLALAVIVARQSGSKDDGLTALVLIVVAYTLQMGISAATRPRSSAAKRPQTR